MSSNSFDVFIPVVVMIGIGAFVYAFTLFVSSLLAAKGKEQGSYNDPYECGEEPTGEAWSMFNVRFYVVGLIFIIFDVESVLMFPIASIFRKMTELGYGAYILVEFLIFIVILVCGIAYCWRKGDLDWVRSYRTSDSPASKRIKKENS